MSGLDLQQRLVQAKAVMDKVDGLPSNTNNRQINMSESNPNLPPVSNNFNASSVDSVIQENNSLTRPEVSFGNQIPNSLIEGAAEKMKSLSGIKPTSQSFNNQEVKTSKPKTQKITQSSLKNLVRETIKESLDELIDDRISQRIIESNGVNESIKLVVGNTIFEGKILTTKKIN